MQGNRHGGYWHQCSQHIAIRLWCKLYRREHRFSIAVYGSELGLLTRESNLSIQPLAIHCSASPPFCCLSLVPEDYVEVVFVSWTLSSRFLALQAGRLSFVALSQALSVEFFSTSSISLALAQVYCQHRLANLYAPRPAHLTAPAGLAAVHHYANFSSGQLQIWWGTGCKAYSGW